MPRISLVTFFIFHPKNPWWYWGPDLRAQLQVPISGIVVLLTVFFSTFIMSTPRILLFKSKLKKFLWCICAEIYVLEKQKKSKIVKNNMLS